MIRNILGRAGLVSALFCAAAPAQITKVLAIDNHFGSLHAEGRAKNMELIRILAKEMGFTVDSVSDQSKISADFISKYDAVVWNCVSQAGDTRHTSKNIWQAYVEGGGAVLSLHASGDTRTGSWPWYMEGVLDAKYNANSHSPAGTRADVWIHLDAIAPNGQFHPILKGQDKFFTNATITGSTQKRWAQVWADEWYNWDQAPDPALPNLTVLLELDDFNKRGVVNFQPTVAKVPFHPMAWARDNIGAGKGRMAYLVTGHDAQIHAYRDKGLKDLWKNALLWATKNSTGCMAPTAPNYNPWVDKDDGSCTGVAVAPKAPEKGFVKAAPGLASLSISKSGSFRVTLSNASGREVFAKPAAGPCEVKVDPSLPKGTYFLKVMEGEKQVLSGLRLEKN
jgi:hypothetical protein